MNDLMRRHPDGILVPAAHLVGSCLTLHCMVRQTRGLDMCIGHVFFYKNISIILLKFDFHFRELLPDPDI